MSGQPVSAPSPNPSSTTPHSPPAHTACTSAHPPPEKPDPTLESNAAKRRLSAASAAAAAELASLKIKLHKALRQFEDFPQKGITFEDILPIFASPTLHAGLIRALELHVLNEYHERP